MSSSAEHCLVFLRAARSPIDDPVGERPRQRVDEQCEEERGDEQQQRQDDVLLVVAPHQVEETLEGVGQPGEGGVRAAEGAGQKNKGSVRGPSPRQPSSDWLNFFSKSTSVSFCLPASYFGFGSGSGSLRARPTGYFSASSAETRWNSASTFPWWSPTMSVRKWCQ